MGLHNISASLCFVGLSLLTIFLLHTGGSGVLASSAPSPNPSPTVKINSSSANETIGKSGPGSAPPSSSKSQDTPSPSPAPTAATAPSSAVAHPCPEGRKNWIGLPVGIITAACALIIVLALTLFIFCRKRTKKELDVPIFDVSFNDEFSNGMGPRKFSYDELAKATKNFADEEKLGEGGFGSVYKGFLRDSNTNVAVKRISRESTQGIEEYESKVKIISRLRHKNLVKLIGWCHEKELLLAYEFIPNGGLDSHLFRGRSLLPWNIRYKIVQGLASALLYLHEEGDFCVLHRDIKTSNIMLDLVFNAKLGDFGFARLIDHAKGLQTTSFAGTMSYTAPECHKIDKASKESDIYNFGIVILEIACGRRSIEPRYEEDQASLVAWVWQAYRNQRLLDVVDNKLSEAFDVQGMECLLITGLWCVHPIHSMRPSIKQVRKVLNFKMALPTLPTEMPVSQYYIPNTPPIIKTSEPRLSNVSITVPRLFPDNA